MRLTRKQYAIVAWSILIGGAIVLGTLATVYNFSQNISNNIAIISSINILVIIFLKILTDSYPVQKRDKWERLLLVLIVLGPLDFFVWRYFLT